MKYSISMIHSRSNTIYEVHTHQFDGVFACSPQVGYQRVLETSTTRVQYTVLRVPFKKYYFLTWTYVGHGSNTH